VYLDGIHLFTTRDTWRAAGQFGVLVCDGAASFDNVIVAAE